MAESVKRTRTTARLSDGLKRQDWVAVAVELLVVVIGVLVALELNQWAERRQTRALQHEYLLRLKEDLQLERAQADRFTNVAEHRLEAVGLLDSLAKNPAIPVKDPRSILCALATVSWGSFPPIHNISYLELQNTGRTGLIRSVALRRALAEHYARLADFAQPGLDRTQQDQFESKTAGLLSTSEGIEIERADGDCSRMTPVTEARARAVAIAWSKRRDAIDELPGLAEHHEFNLRTIQEMTARIDALVVRIDKELRGAPTG